MALSLGPLHTSPIASRETLATVPGDSYTLSYWVYHSSTDAENDFQVSWGGNVVQNLSNASSFGWTKYTFTEAATSTATVLQFSSYEVPARYVSMTYRERERRLRADSGRHLPVECQL